MQEEMRVIHEQSSTDRLMKLMQQNGGGMQRQRPPRANPAQAVAGVATLLGGGCFLAGGIVQAVASPAAVTLTGTYATDTPELQQVVNATSTMGFTSGILFSIGGGLMVVGGGAEVVAGLVKR